MEAELLSVLLQFTYASLKLQAVASLITDGAFSHLNFVLRWS